METGSGDIAVGQQDGPATLGTGSGDVAIVLGRAAALSVSTGSGNVRVALPWGAGADVEIGGGSVRIDPSLAFVGRQERHAAVGRLGRGGERLSVETGSGEVALVAR